MKTISNHAPSIASLIVLGGCSLASIYTQTDQLVIGVFVLLSGLVYGAQVSVPISILVLFFIVLQNSLSNPPFSVDEILKSISAALAYEQDHRVYFCMLLFGSLGVIGATASTLFTRMRKIQ